MMLALSSVDILRENVDQEASGISHPIGRRSPIILVELRPTPRVFLKRPRKGLSVIVRAEYGKLSPSLSLVRSSNDIYLSIKSCLIDVSQLTLSFSSYSLTSKLPLQTQTTPESN